ncbi:MAG: GNAT family N-acetyltransferase [Myxococcales bacterium]|nr:GNAT family N-acetyltransferase [Myxococcales bacterium]
MLLIRRLKVSDLPALERIEAESCKKLPGRSGWLSGFRKLLERTVSDEPEGLMIAELDGRVVGSAIARLRGKHPVSGLLYGHIFHLAAAPEAKDQGVSARLLRECEAYLRSRGCEAVHLSVPADDTREAELYRRSGYRVSAWELEKSWSKPD